MENRRPSVYKTATEALKALWKQGFFCTWKKKAPIEVSLSKWGNHFSDPELGMALKRAKHLTRRGKRGGFEYIQKYPHIRQENAVIQKKKV
jgi:hypothetical protein